MIFYWLFLVLAKKIIISPTFFFFFEKPDPKYGLGFIETELKYQGTSPKIRGVMSSGQSSNQTCNSGPDLARLANASATELQERET